MTKRAYYLLAFLVPALLLTIIYACHGMFPFGDNTYLRVDFYHQYAPFARDFCERIKNGESLLYAWNLGLGSNYPAVYTYYLASPTNLLLFLVPKGLILEALNAQIIIKCALSSLFFAFYIEQRSKKRPMEALAFAWMFALSAFFLAYAGNIIWLDNMALLPLVIWSLENLISNKKCKWYLITMGICIFSNFYMAFLLGIFLVLWFFVECVTNRRVKYTHACMAFARFGLCTIYLLGLCAILLVPMALALRQTQAGSEGFPTTPEFYYSFVELFQRMFMNVELNLLGNEVPNIYASVSILLLIPFYFCNVKIRLRDKIMKGGLLAFLLVSFNLNILDYIWHGLHFPNNFPARESGFFVFLCVTMAYEAYIKREGLHLAAQITASILMALAFAASWIWQPESENTYGLAVYLTTAGFLLAYIILFFLQRVKNARKKYLFSYLILGLLFAEVCVNVAVTGFTSVVIRSKYQEYSASIEQVLTKLEEENEDFYRVEKPDHDTNNDASWNSYRGCSIFSSTVDYGIKEFCHEMGMRTSSVSYSHDGTTPFTDMIFSVKYLIAEQERHILDTTKQIMDDAEQPLFIYECNHVLPLGFAVDADAEINWNREENGPFAIQNSLASAMTGEDVALFYKVPTELVNREYASEDAEQQKVDDADGLIEKLDCTIHIYDDTRLFLYVKTYIDEVKISITKDEETTENTYDDLKFKYIIDLGVVEAGSIVRITPTDDEEEKVLLQAYALDTQALADVADKLSRTPLVLTKFEDCLVRGNITMNEDSVLFTSIPFDEGWTVRVDGVTVETQSFGDAFVCVPMTAGEHQVEFSYSPCGLKEGILISASCALLLLLYVSIKIYFLNRYRSKNKA